MLISQSYRELQEKLHQNPSYGAAMGARSIMPLLQKTNANSILDYGAGKGKLKDHLNAAGITAQYVAYDPAVPEYSSEPAPADILVCLDVCEHIEPEYIDDVLEHIDSKFIHFGVFTVSCYPAQKFMEDGRNAHVLIRSPSWWFAKFWDKFDIVDFKTAAANFDGKFLGHEIMMVCRKMGPRPTYD